MKDTTAAAISNIAYYTFLGLTAYFVTPYILLMLLFMPGFITKDKEDNYD